MKVEHGVMVIKDGKAWGITYEDGQSTSYGWMDLEDAQLYHPLYLTEPTGATWRGSHYEKELKKGKIVKVKRVTDVTITEEEVND